MAVTGLDHYALLTSDLERTTRFYTDVVGLEVGFRPELSFQGVWLYVGKEPIVHIIVGKPIPGRETGAVDHLALGGGGTRIDLTTDLTESLGGSTLIHGQTRAGETMSLQAPGRKVLTKGEAFSVGFDPAQAYMFDEAGQAI